MSKQLELVKQMSQRGCIEDPGIIDMVIKKVLEIPMSELGTNTGSNFNALRKYLSEDSSYGLGEEIGDEPDINDLIGISTRLPGNDRLFYAYHLANAFSQPAVGIKWIRFFSAVSIGAMMEHLKKSSKEFRKSNIDQKFYEAAKKFNLEIKSDTITVGSFLRTAKNKTFCCWLPGGISIDAYTEKIAAGCQLIMTLFDGIEIVYCRELGKQQSYQVEKEPGFVYGAAYTEPKTKN